MAAFAAATLTACAPGPKPPEVLGQAPTWERLVDQQGQPFPSSQVGGRVSVVDFIYTHCTDACPTLSSNMKAVQQRLSSDGLLGTKVVLLSVSVDPMNDTPAALAEYGTRHGADGKSWKFLTGDWDDVYEVVAGFKVGARTPRPAPNSPAPGGNEITHSTRVVVVDSKGQIRAYLRGDEVTPDEIVSTIRSVLS